MLQHFNIVPGVVVPSTLIYKIYFKYIFSALKYIKYISLLLHNSNVATVMNCIINVWHSGYLLHSPKWGCDSQVENVCSSNWTCLSKQCTQDVPSSSWSSWSHYYTYELSCQWEMILTDRKQTVPKPEKEASQKKKHRRDAGD